MPILMTNLQAELQRTAESRRISIVEVRLVHTYMTCCVIRVMHCSCTAPSSLQTSNGAE